MEVFLPGATIMSSLRDFLVLARRGKDANRVRRIVRRSAWQLQLRSSCLFIVRSARQDFFCFSAARDHHVQYQCFVARAAEKQKGDVRVGSFYKQATPNGVNREGRADAAIAL